MRVVVIGAGIAGVATAVQLARDGHEVVVLERRDGVALETSHANAGMLTPSQAPPWNEPGIGRQALRFLIESDATLVVTPRVDMPKFLWLARFLYHSTPARHGAHSRSILALARHSRDIMDGFARDFGIAFDRTSTGVVTLIRNVDDLLAATGVAAGLRALGTPAEILERDATLTLEPSLLPIADAIVGSIYTPEDHSGDVYAFTAALAGAVERLGVTFRFGVNVTGLALAGDRIAGVESSAGRIDGDIFILAGGSFSGTIARRVGLKLPIYPVQGCSITYAVPGWQHLPARPVRDRKLKVAITPLGARIRVTGMAVLDGYRTTIEPRFLDRMRRTIRTIFPTLPADAPETTWSGLRPMTPDGPPILGPTRIANLFLNTGHGPLGWTLGCGTAALVADLIAGRRPVIDPTPYLFARYA